MIGEAADAAISGVAAVLVAIIGVLGLRMQRHTQRKVADVYEHLNNVEADVATDGAPTLGQIVAGISKKVDEGFAVNQDEHHHLDRRLEDVHGEVTNLGRAFDEHVRGTEEHHHRVLPQKRPK